MSNNILKLKKYENQWVALTLPNHKVVGTGATLSKAKEAAQSKGYKDPIFYKVLPLNKQYIG
jgi:hypothetical protein